jgi:hypothetical protein
MNISVSRQPGVKASVSTGGDVKIKIKATRAKKLALESTQDNEEMQAVQAAQAALEAGRDADEKLAAFTPGGEKQRY